MIHGWVSISNCIVGLASWPIFYLDWMDVWVGGPYPLIWLFSWGCPRAQLPSNPEKTSHIYARYAWNGDWSVIILWGRILLRNETPQWGLSIEILAGQNQRTSISKFYYNRSWPSYKIDRLTNMWLMNIHKIVLIAYLIKPFILYWWD